MMPDMLGMMLNDPATRASITSALTNILEEAAIARVEITLSDGHVFDFHTEEAADYIMTMISDVLGANNGGPDPIQSENMAGSLYETPEG